MSRWDSFTAVSSVALGLFLLTAAGCSGATSATSVPPSSPPPPSPTASAVPSTSASSAAAPSPSYNLGPNGSTATAPSSAGLTVGDYTAFKDGFGRVRVAGYLVNNGQRPVGQVQAVVELKDSAGRTLQEEHSILARAVVPPGQRSPFLAIFLGPPPDWVRADVQPQAQPVQPSADQSAILKSVQTQDVAATDNGQGFALTGQVKNGWSKPVKNVTVLGILYDASGKPLDVRQGSATFEELQPGKTMSFSFEFYNSQSRPADQLKYDLYVDASPA